MKRCSNQITVPRSLLTAPWMISWYVRTGRSCVWTTARGSGPVTRPAPVKRARTSVTRAHNSRDTSGMFTIVCRGASNIGFGTRPWRTPRPPPPAGLVGDNKHEADVGRRNASSGEDGLSLAGITVDGKTSAAATDDVIEKVMASSLRVPLLASSQVYSPSRSPLNHVNCRLVQERSLVAASASSSAPRVLLHKLSRSSRPHARAQLDTAVPSPAPWRTPRRRGSRRSTKSIACLYPMDRQRSSSFRVPLLASRSAARCPVTPAPRASSPPPPASRPSPSPRPWRPPGGTARSEGTSARRT